MSSKTPGRVSSSKSGSGGAGDPAPTKTPAPELEKVGGDGSGESGPGGGGDACDLLIDSDLEGVRSAGLRDLAIGSELTVRLDSEGAFRSVVCVRSDGLVVG